MERDYSREAFGFAMDVLGSTRRPNIFNKLAVIFFQYIMNILFVSLDMFAIVVPYMFTLRFVIIITA